MKQVDGSILGAVHVRPDCHSVTGDAHSGMGAAVTEAECTPGPVNDQ